MTRRTKWLLAAGGMAVLGLGAAVAVPALAQPGRMGGMMGERLFEQADADRDGRVTRAEAQALVDTRFRAVDANGDGTVTLEEWQAYAAREFGRQGGREEVTQRRAAMFRALDANADGRLTLEEARAPAEAMFRAADANSDGVVTREELPSRHAGPRGPGGSGGAPRPTPPG
jgi:hypothetical protein